MYLVNDVANRLSANKGSNFNAIRVQIAMSAFRGEAEYTFSLIRLTKPVESPAQEMPKERGKPM